MLHDDVLWLLEAPAMEFILDALHQCSKIAKDEVDRTISYKDMVGSIFSGRDRGFDEDTL